MCSLDHLQLCHAGTGKYTSASGSYVQTKPSLAPTTSAPSPPGADASALPGIAMALPYRYV